MKIFNYFSWFNLGDQRYECWELSQNNQINVFFCVLVFCWWILWLNRYRQKETCCLKIILKTHKTHFYPTGIRKWVGTWFLWAIWFWVVLLACMLIIQNHCVHLCMPIIVRCISVHWVIRGAFLANVTMDLK